MDGQHSDFFFSVLQKIEQRARKCIKLRGECVEEIPSLVAVACFLPGRAKDLSAPLVMYDSGSMEGLLVEVTGRNESY